MYRQIDKNSIVIQKYGGTSVGTVDRIKSVAQRVARQYRDGWHRIGIVVSAMSGETNRLVELAKQVNPNAPARHYDMAVAAGEQVSVALVAAALEAEGIGAEGLLGYQLGIRTDDFHSKARIQEINTARLHEAWAAGRIPVIAGFQGVTGGMEITTLGRGGSDTSAVAVAVAVKAAFCEINTDVSGVYTADPRFVKAARLIKQIDYEVALEMASLGSKVLHSRCVEIGAKFNMPITVRNSFDSDEAERTVIMPSTQQSIIESPVVSGITLDRNVVRITVEGALNKTGTIAKLFQTVAANGVNLDIIVHDSVVSSSSNRVGFTVGAEDLSRTIAALEDMRKGGSGTDLTYRQEIGLAKVSIVGVGMRSHSGVAARAFAALEDAGIPIHMISTSEIKVSCVIPQEQGDLATQRLHAEFVEKS